MSSSFCDESKRTYSTRIRGVELTNVWFDESFDPIIDLKLADSALWMFEADLRQARDEAITTIEQYRFVMRPNAPVERDERDNVVFFHSSAMHDLYW